MCVFLQNNLGQLTSEFLSFRPTLQLRRTGYRDKNALFTSVPAAFYRLPTPTPTGVGDYRHPNSNFCYRRLLARGKLLQKYLAFSQNTPE